MDNTFKSDSGMPDNILVEIREKDGIIYKLYKTRWHNGIISTNTVVIVCDSKEIKPDVSIPIYEYGEFLEKFGDEKIIGHDMLEYPIRAYIVDGWHFRVKLGLGVYRTSKPTDEMGIEIFDFDREVVENGRLEIPETLNVGNRRFRTLRISGLPFPTYDRPKSFDNLPLIKSLVLPNSIQYIYYAGFNSLSGITSLKLPDDLMEIEGRAFCDCTSLEEIIVGPKLYCIDKDFLKGCPNLKTVKVKDLQKFVQIGVLIHDVYEPTWPLYDYYSCDGLKTMGLVDKTLTPIETGTLTIDDACNSFDLDLREIKSLIYASRYGHNTFQADQLTELEVSNEGALGIDFDSIIAPKLKRLILHGVVNCLTDFSYPSKESIEEIVYTPQPQDLDIFNKDELTLMCISLYSCPRLRILQIPEGYKEIESYAFYDCRELKELSIPKSMEKIGACAFSNCFKLEKVRVPACCEVDPLAFPPKTTIERLYFA